MSGNKVRDYISNNYCNFLWVCDLLELKKDSKNAFYVEIQKDGKPSRITVNNVTIFGTIVEVKQIKTKEFLYLVDDGTGVISCKHSIEQFEEIVSLIENENIDILNQTLETQHSLEMSSMTDASAEDSIFNDRSMQLEDIDFNKKCRLKGLQSIWDDIYKSFNSLIEPYTTGDSVIIQGKLYMYFNVNQIYINSIRTMDLTEEIMMLTIKLEDGLDQPKKAETCKAQSDSHKRLSGLITFDNIPHLNTKFSDFRDIETPKLKDDLMSRTPEVVTPNLDCAITFDTFTSND